METAKEKILKLLKKERLATSRISGTLGLPWYYGVKLLNELKEEGKITDIKVGRFTYWELV